MIEEEPLEKPKNKKKNSNGKTKPTEKDNLTTKIRIRGWFPRKCAVEHVDQYLEDDENETEEVPINNNENSKKIK